MQPMPVETHIPGRSLPRRPSTGRLVVPASAGDPDPTVRCFPCGPYDPQHSMLSVGQELRMNWPASNDFRPNAFNATGVITNVDTGNMSAPYTMRVNGEHVPVALDPYSGRLMTKGGLQGGFLPQMEQVEDRSAKQAAGQVLSELKQDGKLSDPYRHISQMAAKVAEICDKENALLELDVAADETCAIFGDVHGNFRCLKNLLGYRPSGKTKFLFLGDFVDRGSQQLEVVAYLFAKKVLFPKIWFLVRGNHEDMALNQRYGFEEECTRRVPNHGAELYQKVNQVFQYLPMAAIVTATQQKGIFCCHGGIGPDMTGRDAIRQCYKPCCGAGGMASQPWERILRDLTWSDVMDPGALTGGKQFDANGWMSSHRGEGMLIWGPVATERFLRHMDCRLIVRAHDPAHAPSSLKQDHDGKVLTIFSSTPYPVREDKDGCISNEGAVMLKLIGATGEISYSRINQYHQLDNRIDEQGTTVKCDPNFQGMPLYQDGFHMPKFTQLSREASSNSSEDGPQKTLFAWRRGLHVVFGNTKRGDGATNLREEPDGPPTAQMLEDGEVVLVYSVSDDKEWVRIKSKKAGIGWTRAMYLHQQLLDLNIDDLHVLPGLQGQFVMKPGTEVIVGADHHQHPGMCPVWATPGRGTVQSVPNGSKAFIKEVDQAGQWVRIECEVPGWTLSKDLHVQAQFTERPQVRPFLPLQHKSAVFGSCRRGKSYPLMRDGNTTDETLNDGEVVLIVKEDGLSSPYVEVQSRRQDGQPKWGWVHVANLHLQRSNIGLSDGMMLHGARAGMCALEPGREVMVGITHKQAQQCALRRAADAREGIGMVQDGEMVEVISLSENDQWVQVKKIDGSCGWLPTMSVHVQLT